MKRTPTPFWAFYGKSLGKWFVMFKATDFTSECLATLSGMKNAKANAHFIVEACNNYERIKKAFEECINKLEKTDGAVAPWYIQDILEEAKKAIAFCEKGKSK